MFNCKYFAYHSILRPMCLWTSWINDQYRDFEPWHDTNIWPNLLKITTDSISVNELAQHIQISISRIMHIAWKKKEGPLTGIWLETCLTLWTLACTHLSFFFRLDAQETLYFLRLWSKWFVLFFGQSLNYARWIMDWLIKTFLG